MKNTLLLSRKLKNAIAKFPGDYTFTLHDININGTKRGCSGFVRNNINNTCIYVDTERSPYNAVPNYMYRYADNEKDFTGYRNRWADTLPELAKAIAELLQSNPAEQHDFRF